tara:strand:- start:283 stop:621 length:339 start_codon:yes stop_codon:yes gene_type:complete
MAYTKSNLLIDQGSTFSTTVTGYDVDGNLLNLAGYSAAGKIKYNYSTGTSLVDFTTSVQDSYVDGLVDLSLTATETAALIAGDLRYDVEVTSGTNVIRIQEGLVRVGPEVTS